MISRHEIVKAVALLTVGASIALSTLALVGVDWSGESRPGMGDATVWFLDPTPSPSPSGYVIPTGSPSPDLPVAEDDPGWDCRVQGDYVCRFQGDLWLNVSHLPPSLYARCLIGLTSTGLSPEVASIDTVEICKPLLVNGG